MKKQPLFILLFFTLLALSSCNSDKTGNQDISVSKAKEYYHQAVEYDNTWQMRLAEMYYKKAYQTLESDPTLNISLYGDAGYRYAHLVLQRGDMETALSVVNNILEKPIRSSERAELLQIMANCQLNLKQIDEAMLTYSKAYESWIDFYGDNNKGSLNIVVVCFCIFNSCIEIGEYDDAAKWLDRMEQEFKVWEKNNNEDQNLVNEYKGHIALNRAMLLQSTGHAAEAAAIYKKIPSNHIFNPVGIFYAARYLDAAGRYDEAADMYARLDTTYYAIDSTRITFDKISECIAPRYSALRKAGRANEALAIADNMFTAVDSALNWQKKNNSAELAIIYQTHEKEMALEEQQTKTSIYRIIALGTLLILILTAHFLWLIHRDNRHLSEKNSLLYKEIKNREQAEAEKRSKYKSQQSEPLTQSQKLYYQLCELMQNPDVFTDANANHETLAHLVGTNYKYVYDALHECADTTPADFINLYRIRYAAQLLSTSNDPIGLVAEQCGITNRSTFNRLFREKYSMSPTEYRKAAKETNTSE